MSEPGEFVLVPRKLTVRDSVTQIENNTSKSEASIQGRTALNVGETETSLKDQLEAVQQREHRDTRDFLGIGTSSRRRCQYQDGKEARKCCNNTQNCSNCKIGVTTGHGYHTPLQDDGNKPMMDLAQSLQTWCVCEHVAASICADEEELTVAQRALVVFRYLPRNRNRNRNRNRQLSVIVNIETDAQTE